MYDAHDDLHQLFGKSVVIYNKRPVFIFEINHEERSFLSLDMVSREFIRSDFESELFSTEPLKLGNVNFNGEVVILSRAPRRQYTQGLSQRNASLNYIGPQNFGELAVSAPEVADTLMGVFPSTKEAVRQLDNGAHSVAVSRNCFFMQRGVMVIGTNRAGTYNQDGEISLRKGMEHATNCLKGVRYEG